MSVILSSTMKHRSKWILRQRYLQLGKACEETLNWVEEGTTRPETERCQRQILWLCKHRQRGHSWGGPGGIAALPCLMLLEFKWQRTQNAEGALRGEPQCGESGSSVWVTERMLCPDMGILHMATGLWSKSHQKNNRHSPAIQNGEPRTDF